MHQGLGWLGRLGSRACPSYPSAPKAAAWPTQETQQSDDAVVHFVGPKVSPTSEDGPPGLCQPSVLLFKELGHPS